MRDFRSTTPNNKMKRDTRSLFKIEWKTPQQLVVKITPEDAEKILANYNHGNRLLRGGGARYIALQIRAGEWVEDHPQPICFSKQGVLLDGQHRIAGIAMAKEEVWASVRFGVDPSVMKYLDTGITRSLCDRVQFVQNTNVNKNIASMVSKRYQMTVKGKPSPESALFIYYEMEDSYRTIAELRKTNRFLATSIVALAFADYHSRYGQEALEMYCELFKISTTCQPIQALKNYLTTTKMVGTTQYPYIVSACLANHEGREVKVLRAASWR
jgi:hypothetical protein